MEHFKMVSLINDLKNELKNNDDDKMIDTSIDIQQALAVNNTNMTAQDIEKEAHQLMNNLTDFKTKEAKKNVNDILDNAKLVGWN